MKKKNITLSIPTPCSENWESMTPNERGRHCANCNKTVVDFSLFTDTQLIEFFSKATGAVCGRLNNMQVERELVYVEPRNSFLYKLLFGTTIALGLAGSANANYNPNNLPIHNNYPENSQNINRLLNDSTKKDTVNYISILVRVHDKESNNPLPFAEIILKHNDTIIGNGITDTNGLAEIHISLEYSGQYINLTTKYIGFHDYILKGITVPQTPNNLFLSIHLEQVPGHKGSEFIIGDTIKQISGTVVDSKDNSPLPFAAVVLLYKGTIVETATTDIDGDFHFKNFDPASPEDLLIKIAYVGYKDKEIKNVTGKMIIKLDVSELHFISVGIIIYTPPAIDQTGHVNTRIHKGDTPYW